jgi:hypothetical protein
MKRGKTNYPVRKLGNTTARSVKRILSGPAGECLQVDTTIEPAVCEIESVKVIQTISHPPIPN